MALAEDTITVVQNEDAVISFGYASGSFDANPQLATPFAFVGTYVEFTARYTSDPNSTLIYACNSASGAIAFSTAVCDGVTYGVLTFTIPHSSTVNFPVGQFFCDMLWQSPQYVYLLTGPFLVSPSVSR